MYPDFQLDLDIGITLTKQCLSDVFPERDIEETLFDAALHPKDL